MNELDIATASVSCVDFDADGKAEEIFRGYKPRKEGLAEARDNAN